MRDSQTNSAGATRRAVICNRVKQVNWQDVREEVMRADANLAGTFSDSHVFKSPACGSLEPGAFLYRAEYEYGSLIVNQGKFVPPACDQGEDCATCKNLKAATENSPIPLAVILENSVEVFLDSWTKEDPRHSPLRLIPAGEMFGTFETLDLLLGIPSPRPPWSVSAGARSVWVLLPLGNGRLEAEIGWDDDGEKPHWEIVKKVAKSDWKVSILIFPEALVRSMTPDDRLYRLILETGWKQSTALRHSALNQANFDSDLLKKIQSKCHPQLGPVYQLATVRHLVEIARGSMPGFQPFWKAAHPAGPFEEFERAMTAIWKRCFQRKPGFDYSPIVLQPGHLNGAEDSVYYSFRCPSLVGLKLPDDVRHFNMIPWYAKRNLAGHQEIDYFAREGEFSGAFNDEGFLITDLCYSANGDGPRKLYMDSPFLVAGARISPSTSGPDSELQ